MVHVINSCRPREPHEYPLSDNSSVLRIYTKWITQFTLHFFLCPFFFPSFALKVSIIRSVGEVNNIICNEFGSPFALPSLHRIFNVNCMLVCRWENLTLCINRLSDAWATARQAEREDGRKGQDWIMPEEKLHEGEVKSGFCGDWETSPFHSSSLAVLLNADGTRVLPT